MRDRGLIIDSHYQVWSRIKTAAVAVAGEEQSRESKFLKALEPQQVIIGPRASFQKSTPLTTFENGSNKSPHNYPVSFFKTHNIRLS